MDPDTDTTKDLEGYSGEDLFNVFKDCLKENQIETMIANGHITFLNMDQNNSYKNINNKFTNALMIKLLNSASPEQIEGFFGAMENEYGEHCDDVRREIGDQLMWLGYAENSVKHSEYENFRENTKANRELFPSITPGVTQDLDYRDSAMWA